MTYRDFYLFDGEGGEGTSGNAGVATSGEEGTALEEKKDDDLFDDNSYDDSEEPDDEPSEGENADEPKDLSAEFEELIKGKYKDLYDARVKDTLSKRFKNAEADRNRLGEYEDALFVLYDKYDIEPGNLNGLKEAIAKDGELLEERAEREGLSVEQYKYQKKLEAENRRLEAEQRKRAAKEQADALYEQWESESAELRNVYPHFNLKKEASENPEFMSYLESGMSVRKAFEAAHIQELISGAIQMATKETRKNTIDTVRARGLRPRENGMQSKAPLKVKKNISNLSNEDMDRINKRVARGETVTF